MWEQEKVKINLKALKPLDIVPQVKTLAEETPPIWEESIKSIPPALWESWEQKSEVIGTMPKISLGMIKKKTEGGEIKETPKKIEMPNIYKDLAESVSGGGNISQVKQWEESTQIKTDTTPAVLINTSTEKEDSKVKQEEATVIEDDFWDKKPSEEVLNFIKNEELEEEAQKQLSKKEITPVQFQNYESWFKKQSVNVIKRIQNFRYTPKTRTGLLIGLIGISCFIIWSLMLIFPEKHSFSIYKTSILELTTTKTPEDELLTTTNNPPPLDITSPQPEETIREPEETIREPEETIREPEETIGEPEETIGEPEETIREPEETIGEPEETIGEPEETIGEPSSINVDKTSIEVRQEKKEKLRQHLLKKYSS